MIIAAGLVIALSALVQGAVGYGMALVAAPLLALVDPMLVPVPLILLTSGHAVLAVIRDGRSASGAGGTAASIGGPPIALLYQDAAGPRVRGTIGGYFVLGSVTSIIALAAAGQVTGESLARTVLLTPFLLIGFALSGPARRLLDNGWTRGAVLAVSAASGVLLIGRVLLSRG
jgi:hypothetical protein